MPAAPAGGARLPWADVPSWLRRGAERQLGGRVLEAVTQPGGFSPGAAARLRLEDGRRAFVKAVGPEPNPDSPHLYRREARIAGALPAAAPAPQLLGVLDEDGWVLLLFEDIDGATPAQPWRPAELARVLAAMTDLAGALTPAPFAAPAAADSFAVQFRGWRQLASSLADGDELAGLDPWAREHLAGLAQLESDWPGASQGATLAHGDLRADNMLLTPGRVWFVDWPWACIAAPWLDLVAMLPSVRLQGGPPPEETLAGHPLARGADPAAITAVLAALAGYFVRAARQPAPPGIPTVRAFQRAQGRVALDWLKLRAGWP
jgi:aminoglycoside phosphotransferase (APT) family kinase protein